MFKEIKVFVDGVFGECLKLELTKLGAEVHDIFGEETNLVMLMPGQHSTIEKTKLLNVSSVNYLWLNACKRNNCVMDYKLYPATKYITKWKLTDTKQLSILNEEKKASCRNLKTLKISFLVFIFIIIFAVAMVYNASAIFEIN